VIYVIRNDRLVEKPREVSGVSAFPAPMVSRMTSFESPVTGQSISSWRQRERDMHAAGAVDPRDIPQKAKDERKRMNERVRSVEST